MKTEPIHRTSMWKFKLSAATMILIPAAVGINYVAKALAEGLKLPVWLGSLGTFLTSMLAGPVAGAISGFINNVIYGLTLSPISTVYAITSMGIGIAVGVLHANGCFSSVRRVFVSAIIIIAIVSAVISTPLNVIFWGGQTGIAWGDSLFAVMVANHAQCGWPHLPMSLSWIFWIKSAWPTWHSSSIVSCRSGWCTSLAMINDD